LQAAHFKVTTFKRNRLLIRRSKVQMFHCPPCPQRRLPADCRKERVLLLPGSSMHGNVQGLDRRSGNHPMNWWTIRLLGWATILLAVPAWSSDLRPALPSSPVWPDGVLRWHYNPGHHPAWIDARRASSMVQDAARKWEACGVRMEYVGETQRRPGLMDGVNVVGWTADLPRGVRALTVGRSKPPDLIERDIAFDSDRVEFEQTPRLLEKVLVHEFGHAIGLKHSPSCNDVMTLAADCPGIQASLLPVVPTANDLARCRLLYTNQPRS